MKGKCKSGFLKICLAAAIVVLLISALTLPVMAADPTTSVASPHYKIITGKVSAIAEDSKSFVVQPQSGNSVIILVDGNTRYYKTENSITALNQIKVNVQENLKEQGKTSGNNKAQSQKQPIERGLGNKTPQALNAIQTTNDTDIPEQMPEMQDALDINEKDTGGLWGKIKSFFNRAPSIGQSASFSDLAEGDGVVVKVMPNETLAKQVMIIKASQIKTVRGTITDVAAATFTITTSATPAQTLTLKWDANTRVTIKGAIAVSKGQIATVVYRADTLVACTLDAQIPLATPAVTATTSAQ